jgi:hypothetical protein
MTGGSLRGAGRWLPPARQIQPTCDPPFVVGVIRQQKCFTGAREVEKGPGRSVSVARPGREVFTTRSRNRFGVLSAELEPPTPKLFQNASELNIYHSAVAGGSGRTVSVGHAGAAARYLREGRWQNRDGQRQREERSSHTVAQSISAGVPFRIDREVFRNYRSNPKL